MKKGVSAKKTIGEVAICSLQGRRKEQEDRVEHWVGKDGSHLLVLCDGAGGHGGGAGASAAAVRAAEDLWNRSGQVISNARDFLSVWMAEAHEAVNAEGERTGMRGRAVVVALVVKGAQADWVHAGDCRVYHLRDEKILKRTRDDSVVQVLFERGDISEEEMGSHPDQNRLLQSLGGKESPRPQHDAGELLPGDRILLCSDGLWEFLRKDEIGMIGFSSRRSLQKQLEHAVSESISRAGEKADNTSAAVLRFEGNHGGQGTELGAAPVKSKSQLFLVAVGVAALLVIAGVGMALIGNMREGEERVLLAQEEKEAAQKKAEEAEAARMKAEAELAAQKKATAAEAARMKAEEELAARKKAEEERKSREAVIRKALELVVAGEKVTPDFFTQVDREVLSSAAEEGDPRAQSVWGRLHDSRYGLLNDDEEALKWYRKAAEQDYAWGQANLGRMYDFGRGVAKDFAEAVKWYRKAAKQGEASAQSNLGWMYSNGRGVAKDEAEAVKWYRKAAEQDDATAQTNLGLMYADGRGVAKDEGEALKWYRKAAEQDDATAQTNLGVMYAEGRGVAQDEKEAVEWYRKAAEQDDATAQTNLGVMYAEGRGVAQDEKEAVEWYRKAAEQGNANAKAALRQLGVRE